MDTPVEQIAAAGRARTRRRRLAKASAVAAAAAGLTLGVSSYGNPPTAPPSAGNSTGAGSVHIHTAAFSVDTKTDGTVHVSWDKAKYFSDHTGLQAALARAGLPVIIKVGEFCKGPKPSTATAASEAERSSAKMLRQAAGQRPIAAAAFGETAATTAPTGIAKYARSSSPAWMPDG